MDELAHLKSLWKQRSKRSADLIIPNVSYSRNIGSLNNSHWAYQVPYAYREALDLRLDERRKKVKIYRIKPHNSCATQNKSLRIPYTPGKSLDLECEGFTSKTRIYRVWTQGPNLKFKQGDTFTNKEGTICVQVQYANPMGWIPEQNRMDEGHVTYNQYGIESSGNYVLLNEIITCTQMQFLKLLIHGKVENSAKTNTRNQKLDLLNQTSLF